LVYAAVSLAIFVSATFIVEKLDSTITIEEIEMKN
jgi:hypothetical protein